MSDQVARLNAALEGRYAIERELGEGGMATVYLADDIKHERKVALKVLKPELAAVVGAERFLAEIKTTANLPHRAEELRDRFVARLDHAARDHTSPLAPNRRHCHCLVHVESHILGVPLHESRPLLWSMVGLQLQGTHRGRAFKLC